MEALYVYYVYFIKTLNGIMLSGSSSLSSAISTLKCGFLWNFTLLRTQIKGKMVPKHKFVSATKFYNKNSTYELFYIYLHIVCVPCISAMQINANAN